jgi:ribonuclease-3
MDKETIGQIEQILGYKFSHKELLKKSFTHSSAVDNRLLSNERLEFLGDSVLATIICQILFERFKGYLEGELTKMKSMLVSRGTCARVTNKLGLSKFLRIGKGLATSGSLPSSIKSGLLEAVIGAIYIDGGFDTARDFILRAFDELLEQVNAEQAHGNYKSLLQNYAQDKINVTPVYILLDEKGPDHNKCFESEVVISERHFPSAWGANKKEAEQKAAFNALVELGVLERLQTQDKK